MDIALIVVSFVLIILVLLQSQKAESAGQIITGGNSDLFKNRKERGSELFISRLTLFLGIVFILICTIISFS